MAAMVKSVTRGASKISLHDPLVGSVCLAALVVGWRVWETRRRRRRIGIEKKLADRMPQSGVV